MRELEPGEVVVSRDGRTESYRLPHRAEPTRCIFEHVYFARPDSRVFGDSVAQTRLRMGARLAREAPAPADIVVPVPDSGLYAAMGYSRESGLPLEFGLTRNHYVGRTFIEPKQSIRNFGVKIKLNPVKELLAGKRVVLVDDSIVRGTTSRKIVGMVREGGAAEVHLRISAPPTEWPCHYGIDTPTRDELIAAQQVHRGDPPVHRGGQPRLPLPRRHARLRQRPSRQLLHRLLDRRLPGAHPPGDRRQAELFPIRAEGE